MEDVLSQIQQLSDEVTGKPTKEQISKLRGLIDQYLSEIPTTSYFKEQFRDAAIGIFSIGIKTDSLTKILAIINIDDLQSLEHCQKKERSVFLEQSRFLSSKSGQRDMYIAWGEEYLNWYKCNDKEIQERINELQKATV